MFDYRVISIGALSHHPLWQEKGPARTAHATTTLIRSEERVMIVDPGLPAQVLNARLAERAGIGIDDVTDVFLTNFRPAHRRGLAGFGKARWWISEAEREAVGVHLIEQFERAEDEEVRKLLTEDIALMKQCQAAPDKPMAQVALFPLPGFTPGTCGLLLALSGATVLIAGDAIATAEHLNEGKVLQGAFDIQASRESFAEAIEIADWIIPGHDNLQPNLTRRMF